MQTLLDWIGHGFHGGTLEFAAPDGRLWTLGQGEPHARVQLRDVAAMRRILLNPGLHFGETYMDHAWEPEGGDLMPVLAVCMRYLNWAGSGVWRRIGAALGRVSELNTPRSSQRNARHHYNLDAELYRRFLDADLHYSCAYFAHPDMSLEAAQQAKCAHIARKLDLRPGARVLDIGCGWGSLGFYLAQHHDARVTGITLSSEQLAVAQRRAAERGLSRQTEFRLEDYRETRGEFDAIVSVGMFEHVGRPQYRRFFERVRELLKPDGTALLHTIGRLHPPGRTNPWLKKYIFPGGYCPAGSEVLTAIEPSRLVLADLEVWRLHYAHTLAEWHRRFQVARRDLGARLGERFCRMWEFYLQAAEASFRWGGLAVFQAQLARSVERLPTTRDYLYR